MNKDNIMQYEVILDECIYSKKLLKALRKLGMRVIFLGRGVSDNFIRQYVQNHNSVIITGDRQLQVTLGWKKSLYLESWTRLKDMIKIIKTFRECDTL